MNEKVAINTVNATKETGNLSPINSNSILRTSSLTERKSTMANQFNSKFAEDSTHNSSCLTADGCFSRHNISRKDELLNDQENYRAELRSFSRSEYEERGLISKVAVLKKMGCALRSNESLEQFVYRNSSKLENS
jgi:hypothetical protein